MNESILVTSAGRRTSLLRAFLEAAEKWNWRVIAGDRDALAPALYFADEAVKLPSIECEQYRQRLFDIVSERSVRLIVPTIDTELPLLAHLTSELRELGCTVLVSSLDFISITGDKWSTMKCFREEGIAVPRSWLPDDIEGQEVPDQLFIKPRDGSASQNAFSTTSDQLGQSLKRVPHAIIQERLAGPEITIDALLDLDGRPIHFIPRQRIRTLGGESIQGVTMDDGELRNWIVEVLRIASTHGARGPLTLQAFLTESGPVLTEINPRFGGGFPLTRAAGGDYPRWILDELHGNKRNECFGEYKRSLYMTRYYAEHFTERLLWE
jgi:carbamoyl-phosphate synthase large subunit